MAELKKTDPDTQFQQAIALHQAGKLLEAKSIYEQLLPLFPDSPLLLTPFGILQYQLGSAEAAVNTLNRSLGLSPDQPNALLNLGNALQDLKQMEEALTSYTVPLP